MQFIGLRRDVLCMRDLGFVYLDSGGSTLRLSGKSFDELLAAEADSGLSASAATHSQFFTWYPSRREATESVRTAMWHPGEAGT